MSDLIAVVYQSSGDAWIARDEQEKYIAIGESPAAAVEAAVERGYDYDPERTIIEGEPRKRPVKVGPDRFS